MPFSMTISSSLGDDVTTSVGGYKLEERGIQLFSHIEGDYFTILGLPLLPLLDFLRSRRLRRRMTSKPPASSAGR